jgi:fumarylacetoacetate (FAA) hydrolase
VKLCRFEEPATPGQARSGIVYGGKVYETDGEKAIAVHESGTVRLLAPVGRPPSVRFFWCYEAPPIEGAPLESQLDFVYLNPACLLGPVSVLKKPAFAEGLSFDPCVVVVVAGAGSGVPVESAEELVLGYTLGLSFADESMEGAGFGVVRYSARKRDMGTAIGPAITTPDEMDEAVIEYGAGKRFQMNIAARINGSDFGAWNLADLPVSLSEVVSLASESCALEPGDVICVALPAKERSAALPPLERGDEIQIVCDRLGSLTTVIA